MLTNAMIVNSQISVKPYFEETTGDDHTAQENKPKVTVLAEILAAGYTLQDQIIEKGLDIDAKYGLTSKIQAYVEAAKAQAKTLDEKYHVTAKATELDHKYHVQDRVHAAVGQGIDYSNQVCFFLAFLISRKGSRHALTFTYCLFVHDVTHSFHFFQFLR